MSGRAEKPSPTHQCPGRDKRRSEPINRKAVSFLGQTPPSPTTLGGKSESGHHPPSSPPPQAAWKRSGEEGGSNATLPPSPPPFLPSLATTGAKHSAPTTAHPGATPRTEPGQGGAPATKPNGRLALQTPKRGARGDQGPLPSPLRPLLISGRGGGKALTSWGPVHGQRGEGDGRAPSPAPTPGGRS